MYLAPGGSWEVTLEAGAVHTIGRSDLDPEVDLQSGLDNRIHRNCGEFTVGENEVEISNLCGWLPLTVTDVDGTGESRTILKPLPHTSGRE